ncbi:MAG TPA: hypothetical protein VFN35_30880 [Ktedonobacteraceae bacterium]|nr:hypothetical protein [Ktedonobacteraceae bacterium]
MGKILPGRRPLLQPSRPFLDWLLLSGQWLSLGISFVLLVLALFSQFSGIILYRLWLFWDYIDASLIPIVLLWLFALTCFLFRRGLRLRSEEVPRPFFSAWFSLAGFLVALPILGGIFLFSLSYAQLQQTVSFHGHTYYVSARSVKWDEYAVLLHECDSAGLFCREIQIPHNARSFEEGSSPFSPVTIQVDQATQTLTIIMDNTTFFVYQAGQ